MDEDTTLRVTELDSEFRAEIAAKRAAWREALVTYEQEDKVARAMRSRDRERDRNRVEPESNPDGFLRSGVHLTGFRRKTPGDLGTNEVLATAPCEPIPPKARTRIRWVKRQSQVRPTTQIARKRQEQFEA